LSFLSLYVAQQSLYAVNAFLFVYESSRGIHRFTMDGQSAVLVLFGWGPGTQCGCPRGRRSSSKGFQIWNIQRGDESAERGCYVRPCTQQAKQASTGLTSQSRTKTKPTVQGRWRGGDYGMFGEGVCNRNRYSGALSSPRELKKSDRRLKFVRRRSPPSRSVKN